MNIEIEPYSPHDEDVLWEILQPALVAGDVFAWPMDAERTLGLAYWLTNDHKVFMAKGEGKFLGSYYLGPNQKGGGSHVANCGYVVSPEARGVGIARRMCEHSLLTANDMGYRAMQFNFVVSTNADAVHLWKSLGFEIVGTLPGAFHHPTQGYVDAFVMYRQL